MNHTWPKYLKGELILPQKHTQKKQVQDKGEIASNVYFQDNNNNNKNTVAVVRKKDRKEPNKV